MGAERRTMIINEQEKKVTAYHEAGHALVAWMLPGTDPVHKVTIIPRGRALGLTMQLPTDDKYTHSKTYLENQLCILYGGRLAEKLIFDEITTGAGNDIERASGLARKMVCEWGMSEELGALTYGKKDDNVFLGKDISQSRDFSDDTARQIDLAVRKLIDTAMDTVAKILSDNKDILTRISEDLLERETIVLKDMENVIEELRPGQYTDRMTKPAEAAPQPQPTTAAPVVEEPAETPEPVAQEDAEVVDSAEPIEEKKNDPEA